MHSNESYLNFQVSEALQELCGTRSVNNISLSFLTNKQRRLEDSVYPLRMPNPWNEKQLKYILV